MATDIAESPAVARRMGAPPLLDVDGVTLQYKTPDTLVTATKRVSFTVERSDRLVLLGPSRCGKSTLLKAVGGYLNPVEGHISINGREVIEPGADRMMVFQEFDQLLPWLSVLDNVEFPLLVARKMPRKAAQEQARVYVDKVHLTKLAGSLPHELSGGMKQRVAIAPGMAMQPDIPLLFPTLTDTLETFRARVLDGTLPARTWTTIKVLLLGYATGIGLAALLTMLAIGTRIGTDFLETMTAMFNPLPAIALLPLALIWFCLGAASLVFVIVHSVLWAVALNTHSGFLGVSRTLRVVGHNYGLKGIRYVARILVPVVFAGLLTVIVIGLIVENLVFRTIERHTVRRWGLQG